MGRVPAQFAVCQPVNAADKKPSPRKENQGHRKFNYDQALAQPVSRAI